MNFAKIAARWLSIAVGGTVEESAKSQASVSRWCR